jgi:ankyrin repeat domain-containing protein 50
MNVAFDQYYKLWEWSKGVIFLGTPHRGSASADLAALLGNIANAAWFASGAHRLRGGVSTSLLRTLNSNSNELNGIGEMFTQRASALSIETFFETYTTQPVGTVVRPISSHQRFTLDFTVDR